MAKREKDIAELALKRYKYVSDAWSNQGRRERDDLRFQDPEQQWDDASRAERRGGVASGTISNARPMLSISKLNQPFQLIRNQQRQARLGINLHPKSPDASPETAEMIQGLYRSIEQESRADQARGWAFARAAWAGRGWYRINTDYDDEGGHPFDQVIRIERILYQDSVYIDPSAKQTDYSDAGYAFVASWLPIERFKALYPDAEVPEDEGDFEAINAIAPDWIKQDGDTWAVRVAEYWYKEYEKQTFVEMPEAYVQAGGEAVEIEEELPEDLPPEFKPTKDARRRKHLVPKVWQCLLAPGGDPLQHLEGPSEWMGQYIPLVPVFGEELQPFDSQRRYVGMVYANKDAQRAYNYAASTLVERMAMEPKAPYMLDAKQVEGYEKWWDQANRRNFPYILYNRFINGQDYGQPQRSEIDMSGSSLAILGLQQFNEFLQSGTFAYDPSLGRQQPQRSGKAIQAEQQQFEISSSGYLYNLADVSMNLEARIVLDLMPKVYDRAERVVSILDEEDQSQMVMLNAPFVEGEDGMPVPMNGGAPQQDAKLFDLSKGVYSVSITVGKSFQTLRQEGSEVIGEIITARPELLPIIGPLYFGMQDFPGAKEIKDLLVKMRAAQYPMLADENKMSPEQMQAQMMQLQQQNQELQMQLQQAGQMIQTKQIESQGQLQKAQLDGETKIATAKIDQETKLLIAELEARQAKLEAIVASAQKREEIQLQTEGKIAEKAADVVLQPPDLTYRKSQDQPLPKGDKRF